MKISNLPSVLIAALILIACDDNTSTLGVDMMPNNDFVSSIYKSYDTETRSYFVGDSVLARSNISYLGRFTDPETGTIIKSDFLAQFHCNEAFTFPDSVVNDSITSAEVKLFVKEFVGDSLTTFKVSVYPLNVIMDPDVNYYTNIDPTKYYDTTQPPIAEKWYTLSDRTIEDSERWKKGYNTNITIPLPREYGQAIYDAYRENPNILANTEAWQNSGLPCSKGFYFKLESGDGAIAYIDICQFNIDYRYYSTSLKKDTVGTQQFAATEEVVQETRFENSNLDVLMDVTDATYLKTPAGIFTEVTLPVDSFDVKDTLNTVSLTLTRYNDKVQSNFKLNIPNTVLLVRLDDYNNGFFENYEVADGVTSYITSFSRNTNTFTFGNISKLINTCIAEKKNGTASKNYNKVLIIPVECTYDSSKKLVKLSHDFSMRSAKLVGGSDKIKLDVIYSRFNQ